MLQRGFRKQGMTRSAFRKALHFRPLFGAARFVQRGPLLLPARQHQVHQLVQQREDLGLRHRLLAVDAHHGQRPFQQRQAAGLFERDLRELEHQHAGSLGRRTPRPPRLPAIGPAELGLDGDAKVLPQAQSHSRGPFVQVRGELERRQRLAEFIEQVQGHATPVEHPAKGQSQRRRLRPHRHARKPPVLGGQRG